MGVTRVVVEEEEAGEFGVLLLMLAHRFAALFCVLLYSIDLCFFHHYGSHIFLFYF